MKIVKRFLVILLMSIITSGVSAQAPTTKYDIAELSTDDVARIKRYLANSYVDHRDSAMAVILLEQNNTPKKGVIKEDGELFPLTRVNDKWVAFISNERGCCWLSFVVTRKEKFVGRLDVRIE
ncbi:MAG: hypothetical protein IJ677_07065 [Alphaproteobacteria bacterium]|nr:hypothetical protein [Alphaproteobacteria bacterium]